MLFELSTIYAYLNQQSNLRNWKIHEKIYPTHVSGRTLRFGSINEISFSSCEFNDWSAELYPPLPMPIVIRFATFPRIPLIDSSRGLAEFRLLYNSILVTGLRWHFNTISIGTTKILSHFLTCVPIESNRIMLKKNGSKKWPICWKIL